MDMRQQINLYHPPEEAPPPKLSFELMTKVFAGTAGVLILVYVIFFVLVVTQKSQLGNLTAYGNEIRGELNVKNAELDEMSDDTIIAREISELQGIYANKLSARKILTEQGLDNTQGFSPYLEALSRQQLDQTWFTKIIIHHGGRFIDLEGKATEPDLVPQILVELEKEKVFDGKAFQQFHVTRYDKETVGFNIETKEGP